jgi:hypothetical protein
VSAARKIQSQVAGLAGLPSTRSGMTVRVMWGLAGVALRAANPVLNLPTWEISHVDRVGVDEDEFSNAKSREQLNDQAADAAEADDGDLHAGEGFLAAIAE